MEYNSGRGGIKRRIKDIAERVSLPAVGQVCFGGILSGAFFVCDVKYAQLPGSGFECHLLPGPGRCGRAIFTAMFSALPGRTAPFRTRIYV